MLLHLGLIQGVNCENKVLNLYIGLVQIYEYLFSDNVKVIYSYILLYIMLILYMFFLNEYYYVKKVI